MLVCTPSNAISTTSSGRHVHGVGVTARIRVQQALGLPGKDVVGHALESLAQHDEPAAPRITRAEMEIRELALAPPVPPLGGKNDEIERVRWLDLDPTCTSPSRLVRRVESLHHDTFVATREGVLEEPLGGVPVVGLDARHDERRREAPLERRETAAQRQIDEVLSVDVEAIEVECGERCRMRRSSTATLVPKRLIVTWRDAAARRPEARSPLRRARLSRAQRMIASTISGTRSVMSARFRVNTRTSLPTR